MDIRFQFLSASDLSALALPAAAALGLLFLEPLLLSLRLLLLIPKESGILARSLRAVFFKGQLISHFSIPALGDVYRFKALGGLSSASPLSTADRIQFIAIERFSESLTLPLIGILFSDLASVKKMIPVSSPLPIAGILALVALFLILRGRGKSGLPSLSSVRPDRIAKLVLISGIGWTLDLFALWLLVRHDGVPLSETMIALIAVSVSSIPPLPWGRWGLFEGILGAALHQSGIPLDRAIALATLFHILMVLPYAIHVASGFIARRFQGKVPSSP
jgi:hypothetical protein